MLVKEEIDWKYNSQSFYGHQWGTDTYVQKPLDYVQVKRTQNGKRPLLNGFFNYWMKDGTAKPSSLTFNDDTIQKVSCKVTWQTDPFCKPKCGLEFPTVTS